MENLELYFTTAKSLLGRLVDPTPIIEASCQENMLPLTHFAFADHKLGIYVTGGVGKGAPVLGYAACKEFITITDQEKPFTGLPEGVNGDVAVVGSLYLDKSIRGIGIASQLVSYITSRIFTCNENVQACLSQCNQASYRAFARNDYQPMTKDQAVIRPAIGKVTLIETRSRWSAHENYQSMYNRGKLWKS
jgi:hypothetical protein